MTNVKEVLKTVRKFELKTNRFVEGLMSGNYYSVFKGRGIEFSEVREYVPGDDIRTIDWNVTARFNQPFVKEFVEERDVNVFIVFDKSSSINFGFNKEKTEIGYEIAASLMFSAARNNDNVGLCLFTDRVEKIIKPCKGKRHVMRLIREMIYHKPLSHETNINNSLGYLCNAIKKRSIIVIISDFLVTDFMKPLMRLMNKHDLILFKLIDPVESSIPDIGYAFIEDAETGEQLLVNTSSREFRTNYSNEIIQSSAYLKKALKRLNIPLIEVKTNEPFFKTLNAFFKSRKGVRY